MPNVGPRSLASSGTVAGQFPWALIYSSFKLTYTALRGQLGYRALVLSNAEITPLSLSYLVFQAYLSFQIPHSD